MWVVEPDSAAWTIDHRLSPHRLSLVPMRGEQIGKYQIIQHLASGGMASVYLARVTGPGGFERHVVLKTLRTKGVADPSLVPMFLDEARLVASLHHRNIAQVFDVGSDNGTYFLAMEYVHGETLQVVMETALANDAPLPLDFGVTVLCATAAGLHHAHERRGARGVPLGIVHRDVAPSNLIVSYDGSIKLIDFGIAKAAERATHTKTGFIKGKAGYMAPEQIRGYPVDRRTDVFALGILAYEVMTLHRAFAGDSQFEALERALRRDLVPPTKAVPGFPSELEEVIMTALEIDPDDRYPNADAMRRDLERVAARLGLATGESVVLPVLEKLFGIRLEPWMGGAAPRYRISEPRDSVVVPLIARARGTGANDAVADDDAITTVPRLRSSEEMVTSRLVVVEPAALELPLPAPRVETPVPVDRLGVGRAVSVPSAPSRSTPRARRWVGAAMCAALLAAAAFASVMMFEPAEPAPRARSGPAAPTHASPPRPPSPSPARQSPAPSAAPATSTEVTLHVTTDPVGATVVLDGVRLGTTPFTGKVRLRSKPAWLKVRRRGSVATKMQLSLDRDVTWSVRLRAARPAADGSEE